MESSWFQEYICCILSNTWFQTTEYTGNTHRLFSVTDHQIASCQSTFYTVKGNKLLSFFGRLNDNFTTFYFTCIKWMQRLSHAMQDIIRYIHYVIDWTQTNCTQFVLQPFRTFFDGHTFYRYTWITQASFCIHHFYLNGRSLIVNLESIHRRTFQYRRLSVLLQISSQVTSNTEMRSSIHTVRRNVHFQYIIALYIIVFFSRSSYNGISRQYNNARMIGTNAYFVFCTDHTIRLYTTQFRPLDGKFLITIV